jgi:hypothetical protein
MRFMPRVAHIRQGTDSICDVCDWAKQVARTSALEVRGFFFVVAPAQAGVHFALDSRVRGNDHSSRHSAAILAAQPARSG